MAITKFKDDFNSSKLNEEEGENVLTDLLLDQSDSAEDHMSVDENDNSI